MNIQTEVPSHIKGITAAMNSDGCLTVYVLDPHNHTLYFDQKETQMIRDTLTVSSLGLFMDLIRKDASDCRDK